MIIFITGDLKIYHKIYEQPLTSWMDPISKLKLENWYYIIYSEQWVYILSLKISYISVSSVIQLLQYWVYHWATSRQLAINSRMGLRKVNLVSVKFDHSNSSPLLIRTECVYYAMLGTWWITESKPPAKP